jgi:hypothetical protein
MVPEQQSGESFLDYTVLSSSSRHSLLLQRLSITAIFPSERYQYAHYWADSLLCHLLVAFLQLQMVTFLKK